MTPEIFKYLLTFSYLVLVLWLSFIGMRRTTDLASFAIGDKQFSPYLIGLTLSASIASTATFVINPGFIYVHGLSAFFHFGIAASGGILTAFLVLTRGFLKFGTSSNAVTIPQWVYHRYQSGELRLFFAVINLLSIAFVVLILVGCSLLVSGIVSSKPEARIGARHAVRFFIRVNGRHLCPCLHQRIAGWHDVAHRDFSICRWDWHNG